MREQIRVVGVGGGRERGRVKEGGYKSWGNDERESGKLKIGPGGFK